MNIKHQETRNADYRNMTLNGLSVKVFLSGAAASGSLNCDFANANIKVILQREGKAPWVVCQDTLKVLGLHSSLGKLEQAAFSTTKSSGVTIDGGRKMVSFDIEFGGHLNLRGNDNLYVEVTALNGFFTDASLTANSFIEVKPRKSVGVETYVTRIVTKTIQAGEASNEYQCGDNIIRASILNYDKSDFSTNVINALQFNSDRLNENYTYQDLVAAKLKSYSKNLVPSQADLALLFEEDQSFLLVDGAEFDQFGLVVQFNAAQVAASANYVVVTQYDTNWEIVNLAIATNQKHEAQQTAKIDKPLKS